MSRKADVTLGALILIILIVFCLGWIVHEGWKECRYDSDCKTNQYCGADFGCHDMKVIVREVEVPKYISKYTDYRTPAWIIGISLVLAALIMKSDILLKKKKNNPEKKKMPDYLDLTKSYHAETNGLYEEDYEG